MSAEKKGFYQWASLLMEAWDGPPRPPPPSLAPLSPNGKSVTIPPKGGRVLSGVFEP